MSNSPQKKYRHERNGESKKNDSIHVVLAAGENSAHLAPALSVALELRKRSGNIALTWVGSRSRRQREICRRHRIPLICSNGAEQTGSGKSAVRFVKDVFRFLNIFDRERTRAVIAFGGTHCASVLAAARLRSVPYFLHEQNTLPGVVSRIFAPGARKVFLGFPLAGACSLGSTAEITGTPVFRAERAYQSERYPESFDRTLKTILLCSGDEESKALNDHFVPMVGSLLENGMQVVWQTGQGCNQIADCIGNRNRIFVFQKIENLYPFYAASRVVVTRGIASILAEIAYFGLPCVIVPVPGPRQRHQWLNAGLVESQGWGIRIAQDDACGKIISHAVEQILGDDMLFEKMSRRALDQAPANAASYISRSIVKELTN